MANSVHAGSEILTSLDKGPTTKTEPEVSTWIRETLFKKVTFINDYAKSDGQKKLTHRNHFSQNHLLLIYQFRNTHAHIFGSWNTMPGNPRTFSGCFRTSYSPTFAVPQAGLISVASKRKAIVLSAPFGPKSPRISPSHVSKFIINCCNVSEFLGEILNPNYW